MLALQLLDRMQSPPVQHDGMQSILFVQGGESGAGLGLNLLMGPCPVIIVLLHSLIFFSILLA